MVYVENEEPETCLICAAPLTYVKGKGWFCRVCDQDEPWE